MTTIRFRLVTAIATALLLILLAIPASADPGGIPHNGGAIYGGADGATITADPDDAGFGGP